MREDERRGERRRGRRGVGVAVAEDEEMLFEETMIWRSTEEAIG